MPGAVQELQAKLNEVYTGLKVAVKFTEEQGQSMSPPWLLQVSQRWIDSPRRLLIVAQQSKGWSWLAEEMGPGWPYPSIGNFGDFVREPLACEALVAGYRYFEFAQTQPRNYRSPAWKAYRQMRSAMGGDVNGFETNTLFTNLFRMDLKGESVLGASQEHLVAMSQASISITRQELALLKPTEVVFVTGPDYEPWLEATFPGVQVHQFKDYPTRTAARLQHPSLPEHTWRTYHPNFFLYRPGLHVMADICGELASTGHPS